MNNLQELLSRIQTSKVVNLSNRQIGGKSTSFKNLNQIITCPNCGTTGKLGGMKSTHFNKCMRPKGYSNQVIVEKFKKGILPSEISKECGISATSVRRVLQRCDADPVGVMLQNRNELYDKIITLKKRGYSHEKIQNELKTSNGTVYRAVKDYRKRFGELK
jgi:DNA invertase Pin-like site-specific DNA recombinase